MSLAFLAGGAFPPATTGVQLARARGHARQPVHHQPVVLERLGSDSNGSPLFHVLSGASMLAAFFIVTEPVSGAEEPRARLLFGPGVGLLTYVIRIWGGYPDGVAFAVLLMNLCVPALERLGRTSPKASCLTMTRNLGTSGTDDRDRAGAGDLSLAPAAWRHGFAAEQRASETKDCWMCCQPAAMTISLKSNPWLSLMWHSKAAPCWRATWQPSKGSGRQWGAAQSGNRVRARSSC